MKIFKFDYRGTVHYIAAPDKEKAKDVYRTNIDWDMDGVEISEIPEDQWNDMHIINPNEFVDPEEVEEEDEDNYFGGHPIIESFAEWMERNDEPDIIATNDY